MTNASLGEQGSGSESPVHLSVILPVRNGEPYLRHQLQALARQQCSFGWEVIVVDNGSDDDSPRTSREFEHDLPGLQVLSEPRKGKANALNTGIAVAKGELLVFVDADDEVGDGYLEAMAKALNTFELVSARMDMTRLNPPWLHESGWPSDRLVRYLGFQICIPGGLIGIRASASKRIGEFNPEIVGGDDVDFTWRAQLLGITTGLAHDAVLHCRRPTGTWNAFLKARSYNRSFVRLYVHYREFGQPRRSTRATLLHIKWTIGELLLRKDHWQWRFAWDVGDLEGRLEESLRQRVWYP